ncbi:MAG TPA: TIGR03667 family PPOX class F420-dependent oxidoreductase [Anaerolineaceae bacterium]|nr:TIGR03667 family PPOX class F420-dependent oxidoreductase [Anaerolineaceae bacterium]
MIDWTSETGKRARQRLQSEACIWLITVDGQGAAQPRPVWFDWDGERFLIFSQANARKLAHIRRDPRVSLHFDGGPEGEDVQVFHGRAEILDGPVSDELADAYLKKYGGMIQGLGYTSEQFFQEYSVPVRVIPTRLRGIS